MKCAKCGQEFGNGSTCINCGADRVSAFGEFQGFGKGSIGGRLTNDGEIQLSAAGYTVCHYCGTPIPTGSKYCPQCKTQLLIECPNCKHICSTEFPGCPNCGVDRNEYFEQLRKAQREQAEQKKIEEERERQKSEEKQEEITVVVKCCQCHKSEIKAIRRKQKKCDILWGLFVIVACGSASLTCWDELKSLVVKWIFTIGFLIVMIKCFKIICDRSTDKGVIVSWIKSALKEEGREIHLLSDNEIISIVKDAFGYDFI